MALIPAPGHARAATPLVTHERTIGTAQSSGTPMIALTSGSDLGIAWTGSGDAGRLPIVDGYRLFSSPSPVVLPAGHHAVFVGHTLWQVDGDLLPRTWTATDLDTGAPVQTYVEQQDAEGVLGVLPHGLVLEKTVPNQAHISDTVRVLRSDGSSVPLDLPEPGWPTQVSGDDRGVLLEWKAFDSSVKVAWFATATAPGTKAVALPDAPALTQPVAWGMAPDLWNAKDTSVSPQAIAYLRSDGQIARYSRIDGTLSLHATSGIVTTVAATDTGVAWETAGSSFAVTTCAEPGGPCASVKDPVASTKLSELPPLLPDLQPDDLVLGPPGSPDRLQWAYRPGIGVVGIGGDFAMNVGSNSKTHAISRLTPGGTKPAAILDRVGQAPPVSVDVAPGRLLVDLGWERYEQTMTPTGFGAVTVVPGQLTTNVPPAYSGSRTVAAIEPAKVTSGGRQLVVTDGASVVARWGPFQDYYDISISGDRVLVSGGHRSRIFSISHPDAAPIDGPANGVLYGDRIASLEPDDSLHLYDVTTKRDRLLLPAPVQGYDQVQRNGIQLYGDWISWTQTTYHHSLFDVDRSIVAVHLDAHGDIDRTTTAYADTSNLGHADVILRQGFLVLVDKDRQIHLHDLGTGVDEVVGVMANTTGNGRNLGADDDNVVWVGRDDRIHVIDVHPSLATPPEVLGITATITASSVVPGRGATAPRVTPRGLSVRVDTSRRVTRWQLTVKDAHGHVVATRSGSGPKGTVLATWDGRVGSTAAHGRFTWRLTGKGPGGTIVRRGGRTAMLKGALTL